MATLPAGSMAAQLDLCVDAAHELGEGVTWCERKQLVYWTDIHASRLHAFAPAGGARSEWVMPERLCCLALTLDEDVLLLGLESKLVFFNLRTQAMVDICDIELDLPTTRLNDGRLDRQGRFVFGTLNEEPARAPIGRYYRLNADLTVEELPLPQVAISNSTCFSADGQSMYFCDTMQGVIHRWDGYASGDASADQFKVFVDLSADSAGPDGAIIDADGYLWSAQWGGARVVRYAPDGSVERILHLPVSQPSCPCLGGPQGHDLFVTTAYEHMTPEQRAEEPLAGGLFHTHIEDVRALPEVRFGATLPAAVL
jgi:L-arabinonolactonase